MARKMSKITADIPTVDDAGKGVIVHEHTEYLETGSLGSTEIEWTEVGLAYRLGNGRAVNLNDDGSFQTTEGATLKRV